MCNKIKSCKICGKMPVAQVKISKDAKRIIVMFTCECKSYARATQRNFENQKIDVAILHDAIHYEIENWNNRN